MPGFYNISSPTPNYGMGFSNMFANMAQAYWLRKMFEEPVKTKAQAEEEAPKDKNPVQVDPDVMNSEQFISPDTQNPIDLNGPIQKGNSMGFLTPSWLQGGGGAMGGGAGVGSNQMDPQMMMRMMMLLQMLQQGQQQQQQPQMNPYRR